MRVTQRIFFQLMQNFDMYVIRRAERPMMLCPNVLEHIWSHAGNGIISSVSQHHEQELKSILSFIKPHRRILSVISGDHGGHNTGLS
jgi:hypothetical protein